MKLPHIDPMDAIQAAIVVGTMNRAQDKEEQRRLDKRLERLAAEPDYMRGNTTMGSLFVAVCGAFMAMVRFFFWVAVVVSTGYLTWKYWAQLKHLFSLVF